MWKLNLWFRIVGERGHEEKRVLLGEPKTNFADLTVVSELRIGQEVVQLSRQRWSMALLFGLE